MTLKIVDLLITIIVLGLTLFFVIYWKYIPRQLPQHWNAAGEIDRYADASSYIMLFIFMYFFYIVHNFTKLIPQLSWKENFFGKELAEKVSEEVGKKALNTLLGMLWYCDLLLQLMIAYIIVCGVFVRNLGVCFLPLLAILLTADFVWFGIQSVRIKNQAKNQ